MPVASTQSVLPSEQTSAGPESAVAGLRITSQAVKFAGPSGRPLRVSSSKVGRVDQPEVADQELTIKLIEIAWLDVAVPDLLLLAQTRERVGEQATALTTCSSDASASADRMGVAIGMASHARSRLVGLSGRCASKSGSTPAKSPRSRRNPISWTNRR
jgi:hypothetical protein